MIFTWWVGTISGKLFCSPTGFVLTAFLIFIFYLFILSKLSNKKSVILLSLKLMIFYFSSLVNLDKILMSTTNIFQAYELLAKMCYPLNKPNIRIHFSLSILSHFIAKCLNSGWQAKRPFHTWATKIRQEKASSAHPDSRPQFSHFAFI